MGNPFSGKRSHCGLAEKRGGADWRTAYSTAHRHHRQLPDRPYSSRAAESSSRHCRGGGATCPAPPFLVVHRCRPQVSRPVGRRSAVCEKECCKNLWTEI